jgi:predicted nucleic acid-binding protein
MAEAYLISNLIPKKSISIIKIENLLNDKLKNYIETSSLNELNKKLELFLIQKPVYSVKFKLNIENEQQQIQDDNDYFQLETAEESFDEEENYTEILKLRHLNISS